MHLTKHHGLENDFLVALVDAVPADASTLAQRLCARHTGVGADGLIFGVAHPDADIEMVLFNADGSSAEISGNGIRCLAQALAEARGITEGVVTIAAGVGVRRLELKPANTPNTVLVSVSMGQVTSGPPLPELAELQRPGFRILNAQTGDVGNPHVILLVDDVSAPDAELDGAALEQVWMPTGINVHFLAHSAPNEITLVHRERGAGVTAACGSGATVAATIAHQWGLVGPEVSVVMPGGEATVLVGPDAVLVGPSVKIADIEIAGPTDATQPAPEKVSHG